LRGSPAGYARFVDVLVAQNEKNEAGEAADSHFNKCQTNGRDVKADLASQTDGKAAKKA